MFRYWVLMTLFGVLSGARADQCRINPASTFTVFVSSHRNLTGHWILSVDTKRALSRGREGGVTVEAAQLATSCGDGDSDMIQMMTTATVEPPEETNYYETNDVSISLNHHLENLNKTTELLQTTVLQTTEPAPTEDPVDGYVGGPGLGYYKVHTEKLSWKKAQETCEREGAHLMVIDSEVEVEIFKSLHAHHREAIESTGWNNVQVGVYDPDSTGEFVTVLGDPVRGMRWYLGAPNTSRGSCGTALHDSKLYNMDCEAERSFICERRTAEDAENVR